MPGGGFGLAMAADFVIATEDSGFATPEIQLGLWPFQITVPLLRHAHPRLVLELMMIERKMSAQEALSNGMINQVCRAEELEERVGTFCVKLASNSLSAMGLGKKAFYDLVARDSAADLSYLHSMLTLANQTIDASVGIRGVSRETIPKVARSIGVGTERLDELVSVGI